MLYCIHREIGRDIMPPLALNDSRMRGNCCGAGAWDTAKFHMMTKDILQHTSKEDHL